MNLYLVEQQIDATHWKTVQANLAAAQGQCPVIDEDLPEGAESVVVNGRKVFVCCAPCFKKIQAEPAVYMAKINGCLMSRQDRWTSVSRREIPDYESKPR